MAMREAPWHAMPVNRVREALGLPAAPSPDGLAHGLSEAEARARLAATGPNRFQAIRPVPLATILLRQFTGTLILLLVVAAGISFATGDRLDALAILAVLLLNGLLGFVTEWRARRAMEGLLALDVGRARVRRDGHEEEVPADTLVPGDVILVEAGQTVPADARLTSASGLAVLEAPLTGESVAVEKDAKAELPAETPLPARRTMLYKGTPIVTGRGEAMVVATGMATEVGRVGALAAEFGEDRTPLERRLEALGKPLAIIATVAAVLAGLFSWRNGVPIALVLETTIALAVAAVPEGLPAVATITLALGVHRMARRNALIRRLPSVETLGSTSVICTDKTGTLTTGVMTATVLRFVDGDVPLVGEGRFSTRDPRLTQALRIGALANRAAATRQDGHWIVAGDPTESALLVAAREAGLDLDALRAEYPETGEIAFSSERMYMATFHEGPAGPVACVKGAPIRVLERATRLLTREGPAPLDPAARARLLAVNRELAARGLRVLALAEGPVPPPGEEPSELLLVGFVGLADPPAEGVAATIDRFRRAGIRTVMITGDQRATAEAVARELGLLRPGGQVLDGAELDRMSDVELAEAARRTDAWSRVSPEGKLRLVAALQREGAVVAMLGDGINDAAALRKANIGVAMGRRGADLAREAADVILADDRFATIGTAVEEGRVIHDNVRKAVVYLLACNVAELAVVLLAAAAGWPAPLRPLQILWLNLLTDTIPALALAVEPPEPGLMDRPPAPAAASLLPRKRAIEVAAYGALIAAATLGAFAWGLANLPDQGAAAAMAFLTLAFAQLFHLGNARREREVTSWRGAVANPLALVAVLLTAGLQLIAAFWPPLARILAVPTLPPHAWLVLSALALAPALLGQLWKAVRDARA
jgi:Ca2+-transporting ATPase